jgi:hypothetical protein
MGKLLTLLKNLLIFILCMIHMIFKKFIYFYSFIERHTHIGSNVLDLTGGAAGCFRSAIELQRSCVYNDIDPNQARSALDVANSGKLIFSSFKYLTFI